LNTGGGTGALSSNTTGFENTAYGASALQANTGGIQNTASGASALESNTGGSNNTASGVNALGFITTGFNNIALGTRADSNLANGSVNIYLGHPGVATESNTMRLGEEQTRTFIAGVAGVPVSGSPVFISSTGQLGTRVSSARYKRDIEPMGAHSQGLFQLRPVTFRYRQDPQGEQQYGLIAEEVASVYPELITRGATGEVESVRYEALMPLLLHELQHQQQQVTELQAQNAALAARLERLEEAVARMAALASR
jgi:Chaperone of endosialidase